MNISINGESYSLPNDFSLLELLTEHQFANKIGIAVAVNQSVIPKTSWEATAIQDKDSILIISATKGG